MSGTVGYATVFSETGPATKDESNYDLYTIPDRRTVPKSIRNHQGHIMIRDRSV